MIILNLSHGLAVTQKILGAELSPKGTRHLIHSLFDHLISSSGSNSRLNRGKTKRATGTR
jgi:hypothetical protein